MTEDQEKRIAAFFSSVEQANTEAELERIRDALVGSMKRRNGVLEASDTAACGHVITAIHDCLEKLGNSVQRLPSSEN